MLSCRPHTGPIKLVVSFDIGTIYSSVSYCILEPGRVPKVRSVARFLGQGVAGGDNKVPSLLYYDKTGTVRAAGAEVLTEDVIETASTEGWQKAEWWKLHLRPRHLEFPFEELPPLPSEKSVVDVLSDFIKHLSHCCRAYIQGRHSTFSWSSVEDSIEYILTYPGGWDEQQYLYRQAVQQAGLVPGTSEGQKRVYMLTECEASLHSFLFHLSKSKTMSPVAPERVVVIDAGGGTVCLSIFSLSTTLNGISCEETAPAQCQLQGSLFVSYRAKALIQGKLQGWEHSSTEDIARYTREFDETTKRAIDSDQIPAYVRVADRRTESLEHSISSGQLRLSGKEAASLFNDSVDAVINSFEQQPSIRITAAFLVGGLSKNVWFSSRLQSYFKTQNIAVYHSKHSRNEEVANGAVMSLVDHDNRLVVPRTVCPGYHAVGQELFRVNAEYVALQRTACERHDRILSLESENESLHSLLRAHEQKHQSETLYNRGLIKDAAKSFLKLLIAAAESVQTNGVFAHWIPEYTHRCLSKLVTMGDAALNAKSYEDAVDAYSIALSLRPHPDFVTVLNKWAKSILMRHSAHEALSAAAKFKLPKFDVCRTLCDILEENGRVEDAIIFYRQIDSELVGDMYCSDERTQWECNFLRCCVKKLENIGDDAMKSDNYPMAVKYFSTILSLNIPAPLDILVKRSKALAMMSSWDEALHDADEVIKLNSSDYRGYERRYVALYGAKRYADAVGAFLTMRTKPGSHTTEYVDPMSVIKCAIERTLLHMPKVLIDTTTGCLCDRQQQMDAFLVLPIYSELVSSMTTSIDCDRIKAAVKEFYRYTMLSHRWEPPEPDHQQVKNTSVYDLAASCSNYKLQRFCSLVRTLGFKWAWSDSSCVDRSSNVILQESLVAMFAWYRGSSLTIVYLRGISSKSQRPGDLVRSIWNTRAWTYQEYVAPSVIRFYTEEWEPYLGLDLFNHKESSAIIAEMQQVTGVSAQEMASLRPGRARIREKLYLASGREAMYVEDIAYSLFGIFDAALPVIYGEGDKAVGRLLENILTGSGDVTILAWTGDAGSYNSCLPSDLTVYDSIVPSHVPQPIEQAGMNRIITTLRSSMADCSPAELMHRLHRLQPPSISAKRLRLPCILFPLTDLVLDTESAPIFVRGGTLLAPTSRAVHASYLTTPVTNVRAYRANTLAFGEVEINTADDLTGKTLSLVHPWIRPLLHQEYAEGANGLDETTRALRILARLRQPFGALLLEQSSWAEYRRIAADCFVKVQIREEVTLQELMSRVGTIEVV